MWCQKHSSKRNIVRRIVAKLSLFMGSDDLIMVGRGWLWVFVGSRDSCG